MNSISYHNNFYKTRSSDNTDCFHSCTLSCLNSCCTIFGKWKMWFTSWIFRTSAFSVKVKAMCAVHVNRNILWMYMRFRYFGIFMSIVIQIYWLRLNWNIVLNGKYDIVLVVLFLLYLVYRYFEKNYYYFHGDYAYK